MATPRIHCYSLNNTLVLAIAIVLLFCSGFQIATAAAANDCTDDDFIDTTVDCFDSIKVNRGPNTPPSKECCAQIQKVDLVCVCGYDLPDFEKLFSGEKLCNVSKTCGKTIPSGTKCGAYTVP